MSENSNCGDSSEDGLLHKPYWKPVVGLWALLDFIPTRGCFTERKWYLFELKSPSRVN